MKSNRRYLTVSLGLLTVLVVLSSCTTYEDRKVSFRHPSAYSQMQVVAGAQMAAEAYADPGVAKESFGFDILSAGLLPVQVVIDNQGSRALEIVPEQTFLIDADGGMWNLLSRSDGQKRLSKSTEYGRVASKAGRSSLFGAAGGALIGAAIGVLSGENVAETAAKGMVLGGAGGAVLGGGKELAEKSTDKEIARDMEEKEIRNRPIEPGSIGRGFLFFPSEAKTARELRLQVREVGTNQTHTVNLAM